MKRRLKNCSASSYKSSTRSLRRSGIGVLLQAPHYAKPLLAEQLRWSLVRPFVEAPFVFQTARLFLRAIFLEAKALVLWGIALVGRIERKHPEQDHRQIGRAHV